MNMNMLSVTAISPNAIIIANQYDNIQSQIRQGLEKKDILDTHFITKESIEIDQVLSQTQLSYEYDVKKEVDDTYYTYVVIKKPAQESLEDYLVHLGTLNDTSVELGYKLVFVFGE